jgi:hypothetical protein
MSAGRRKHRNVARLLLVFSIAVIFACCISIAAEAHHECSGEHCPVCAHIHLCVNMVQGFLAGRVDAPFTELIGTGLLASVFFVKAEEFSAATPVGLRVRQNN